MQGIYSTSDSLINKITLLLILCLALRIFNLNTYQGTAQWMANGNEIPAILQLACNRREQGCLGGGTKSIAAIALVKVRPAYADQPEIGK